MKPWRFDQSHVCLFWHLFSDQKILVAIDQRYAVRVYFCIARKAFVVVNNAIMVTNIA